MDSANGMGKESSGEPRSSVRSRDLIRSGDRALVVNFQGAMTAPEKLSWRELGFQHVEEVPFFPDEALILQVGALPPIVDAWQQVLDLVEEGIRRVLDGCEGRVHLFLAASHPVALLIGRRLDQHARLVPVCVHHWNRDARDWEPFLWPDSDVLLPPPGLFFQQIRKAGVNRSGSSGIVVSIDIPHAATEGQLERLAKRVGARDVYRVTPQSMDRWISDPAAVRDAAADLRNHFDKLRASHPGEPIHIATSAPVALLVELGRHLRPTVFSAIIIHRYDAPTDTYYPVLDIIQPAVVPGTRHQLEIFNGEGAVMFSLDGRVLRGAVGSREIQALGATPLGGSLSADPHADLMNLAEATTQHVLPSIVAREIEALDELDIELHLKGAAANLPWELLFLPSERFAAVHRGWTLTRFMEHGKRFEARSGQGKRKRPKILIVPALSQEGVSSYLRLGLLEDYLSEWGADVRHLEYGVPAERIETALREFQPDILHWIGHGGKDSKDGWPTVVEVVRQGAVDGFDRARLTELLGACNPRPRLVMLCACNVHEASAGFGVPVDLIRDGVGATLAYRAPVAVGEVAAFSFAFYHALMSGQSIREAVQDARYRLYLLTRLPSAAFAGPLLSSYDPAALGPLVSRTSGGAARMIEMGGSRPRVDTSAEIGVEHSAAMVGNSAGGPPEPDRGMGPALPAGTGTGGTDIRMGDRQATPTTGSDESPAPSDRSSDLISAVIGGEAVHGAEHSHGPVTKSGPRTHNEAGADPDERVSPARDDFRGGDLPAGTGNGGTDIFHQLLKTLLGA